jgi:ADP-heptose:LPS heptosyltransferase
MSVKPDIRILVSRTDAIGDVMLTLPLCGLLKEHLPKCKIIFLGRSYTAPVLRRCSDIDIVMNYDEWTDNSKAIAELKSLHVDAVIHVFPNKRVAQLACNAGIPLRIGTSRRWYHWFYCNKRVFVKRKNSPFHEAQLNIKLLQALGISNIPPIEELHHRIHFSTQAKIPAPLQGLIRADKKIILLHPKSAGSAREWPPESYSALINLLDVNRYQIIICGTQKEKELIKDWLATLPHHVVDAMGKMNLDEYIELIASAHALIAASTGPLHIAAACGIKAIGIYPPIKPMHPARWQPIGKQAVYLSSGNTSCMRCKDNPRACLCMNEVKAMQVLQKINM